ncbi:MAG: hypothetical protein ACYDD4_01370 [Acidimicrobiales bacterium]
MTPRRPAKTRRVTKAQAHAYLAKATEFLRAAQDSLELRNFVAATGNAVHAGIAAADVVAATSLGAVWAGEHTLAAGHLESAGAVGKQAAAHLRRLLPLKNRAEYDPVPVPAGDARAAVKAAERLVQLARTSLPDPG